jgi:hypothetical protein
MFLIYAALSLDETSYLAQIPEFVRRHASNAGPSARDQTLCMPKAEF